MRSVQRFLELEACLERFSVPAKIQRKDFLPAGQFPIVSQEADFINGYWDRDEDVCRIDRPVVIFGDHTRVLKFIDFDFVVGADGVKVLKPQAWLDAKFLMYFIEANPVASKGYARHFRHISTLKIPIIPLEEQRRIVAILDEVFEGLSRARTNAEANLQSARELFERAKDQAFVNWSSDAEPVTLAEVSEISASLVDPREFPYCDMPHIGAGNMVTGSDELVGVMTAKEERLKSGKYTFDDSVVLYSKIRPYLRKVARPDFSGLCSADVYPLVPNPKRLNKDFLFHLLLTDHFTSYAEVGSARAGMPKVNREHLFAYSFSLPSLESQRRIAVAVDDAQRECSRLARVYEEKLRDISELRQSLLQKAFAGELTVKEFA